MKKCVILSMDDTQNYEIYDSLLQEPLEQAGWQVTTLSWKAKCDWDQFDLVMIRSTWDYQNNVEEFLNVLTEIEQSSAQLDNPLEVVKWNINKHYLKTLEDKGVSIVPTVWLDSIEQEKLDDIFSQINTEQIIIKPCISANADDTFWLNRSNIEKFRQKLSETFLNRDCMAQPFMQSVVEEGEYSLFYFNGEYSHTILKTPKDNDFRVQEEHGGRLKKVEPEEKLIAAAENTLKVIDDIFSTVLLYARLDFVRYKDDFVLMEAELIEPSLYFNLDEKSPQRFVDALEKRMQQFKLIVKKYD